MEKAAVYLPMREAIGKGVLNFSGTRPTGGKRPSNLYQVADTSSEGRAVNTEISAPVPVPAPVVAQTIPEAPPAQVIPSEVIPEPIHEPVVNSAPNPAFPCPLCEGPMTVIPDATGVMVKCYNELCDPQCHENPFGHGSKAKDAYETACQKYRK